MLLIVINKKSQKPHGVASVAWRLYDVPSFEE